MRLFVLAFGAVLALSGCFGEGGDKGSSDRPALLRPASFADLPGWHGDLVEHAVLPLARSCARRLNRRPDEPVGPDGIGGMAGDWKGVCEDVLHLLFATTDEVRAFFEKDFSVYQVRSGRWRREGLFTGYYEPSLEGARERKTGYEVPLYKTPPGIVTADLGLFREEWKGKKITGRVNDGRFEPFDDRAAIEQGVLAGQGLELVWAKNAVDAFFLQIQGSGRVMLDDGGLMRVGYAAANGRPYVAIGRELIARGALAKDNVSMQTIRSWLESHPDQALDIMNLNPSYVFFRELSGGAQGGEGVELTPGRSLAVDAQKLPYGAPLWLDAEGTKDKNARIERLVVAQDTGGAIRGAVRGDLFWGAGKEAEEQAGVMKSRGFFWILLPKGVKISREKTVQFWWDAFL